MIPPEVLAVFTERERQYATSNDLQMARILAIRRLRDEGLSWREIGGVLGLSHEWCRQLSTLELTVEDGVQ